MSRHCAKVTLTSPEKTCRFAQELGQHLVAGDTILLAGEVGAGKSHFARCLIRSRLAVPEDIPSPTYTLVQTYDSDAAQIWHADLYRLADLSEIEELGLNEAFTDAICLVEWPDRLGDQAPQTALTVRLDSPGGDDRRVATLCWDEPAWGSKLEEVLDD
ncbi:tRNA (adenosine(37)-N6)-threonylcarbamoyltransferase complex ATPase subunit type 1 TsaE [Roseovarius aestuarii]|uniref:tRNA threonylcarbamoyladenosine biosynthesis protein TsaE n=1 Tax=Roseovarius aestuarii TaxID=475083 RepID=A0A1X7BR72_9RHOB|nr:tRNA (adenosine(37)-N6)-threonylcarbamoyltransferase complex ATPase subunit type 1 TsaE [Roseovarius aestuarii]SMC12080.1 tRNA threonylcarbamoyladenosine biosynthesis protein TsaE [Roseovarius aestuarii]